MPPDELVEIEREQIEIDRRRFLIGLGAAAGGVALGGCHRFRRATVSAPERDAQVIVVGAGLAGLVCALRIKQAGVSVRLVEAQNRLGGRVLSLRGFFPEDQVADLGGEFVGGGDQRFVALAEELGVPLDDLGDDDPALASVVWHFEGRSYGEREIVDALRPIAVRIRADLAKREREGPIYYDDPNGMEEVDKLSVADWLDRAGANGWVRSLIETAWTAEYGVEPGGQSALNLVLALDERAERRIGGRERRFRVRGGADLLVKALGSRLEEEIEMGSRVEAVRELPSWAWTVTARRDSRSRELSAAHLVLALPFPLLREMKIETALPPIKRYAIDHLPYGTGAKLLLGFREHGWRSVHRARGTVVSDLGFQTAWEACRGAHAGVIANQAGGERGLELGKGTLAQQTDLLLGDLDLVFPGIAPARTRGRAARMFWPAHPFAKGSRSTYGPAQWTLFG
ncbi:MAG: flavin monoamine oxidase family protein, partial [Candidatus Binatia bacterium]